MADAPNGCDCALCNAVEQIRLLTKERDKARAELQGTLMALRGARAEAQAQPTTYQPILGGDAAEALGGKPLRTAADVRIAELEAEVAALKEQLEETEAAADDQDAALGEGVETFKHNQARIAELESTLKATEERLQHEERASVAVLSAVTRLASAWKGQHDGPRAQLLEALEVAENAQSLTEQWDRALQRAAELGRQESAALVAELRQIVAAALSAW